MSGWIGVDLDATLAEYDGWKGIEHIGEPILPMVNRVKQWLSEGEQVKIFTARAYGVMGSNDKAIKYIQDWCLKNIGVVLPVTCVKDFGMIVLYDDRAIQVKANTGELVV